MSGTTLAILTTQERASFLEILRQFKQRGGRIIFDNNYRPQLWAERDEARSCYLEILALTEIAFLTDDDEEMVFGASDPNLIINRCVSLGVKEIVIKRGAKSCIVFVDNERLEVQGEKVKTGWIPAPLEIRLLPGICIVGFPAVWLVQPPMLGIDWRPGWHNITAPLLLKILFGSDSTQTQ